jgi:hypothetical protein
VALLAADEIRELVEALNDDAKFPDEVLDGLVAEFTDVARDYRGQAFEATSETETTVLAESTTWLRLRWPLVTAVASVTVTAPAVGGTSTSLSASDYTVDAETGHLYYPAGFTAGSRVVVAYTHGEDGTTNAPLVRACRLYVRSCALSDRTTVGRDVIATTVDGNIQRFSTPDANAGRPTGWLEVDRLLNSLPDRRRIVA